MKENEAKTHLSSLTSKFQATIPQAVRKQLGLRQKDKIIFVLGKQDVTLHKATPLDMAYLKSLEGMLEEWGSANDEEAYRDL